VAHFAEMLSLPNDGRYPASELTPQQRRQRTLQALVSQMQALAVAKPLLIVFEDIHWADPTSIELLGRVVAQIATLRVLLLITFRPEFAAPWIGRPYVTTLTINRLVGREVGAIIDRMVGNKALPAGIRMDIIERTDGIPLFVEEMTKAVLEARSLDQAEHTASTIPTGAVPSSLHASLMARLDRLGPAKEVAQVGAAIGREFSHALLGSVLSKSEAELTAALDRLMHAGLLFRQGLPPHASYLFKHALVQDAAYGTLLREPRRALHSRIADALESHFPEIAESQPELLAHHLTESRRLEEAVAAWERAGDRAVGRSAFVEGIADFRRGLEILETLPQSKARTRHELAIYLKLGGPVTATRGYAAPEKHVLYTRARTLCEESGETEAHFDVLEGLWGYHYVSVELEAARDLGDQLLTIVTRTGDGAQLLRAYTALGCTMCSLGEYVLAREHLERALEFHDPERHIRLVTSWGADPGGRCVDNALKRARFCNMASSDIKLVTLPIR
jgi:predicted ATPase